MNRIYTFFALFCILLLSCNTLDNNNNIEGTYSGVFKHESFQIDLRIDLESDSLGYNVFFTSLEQNALRIPTKNVSVINDSLKFTLQSDFYTYVFNSKYDASFNTLQGVLTIDSKDYPYSLDKVDSKNQIKTKDISFESNGNTLSGTIWLPNTSNGKGLFFVTSSGMNDRSSSRAEVQYFSKKGFTVYHYDKRGTGKSTGSMDNVSIEDLAKDDITAIQQFSKATKIPLEQISIIGSSQGGAKIPLILNILTNLQSGISISTPGCSLLESDLNFMMNTLKNQIKKEDLTAATLVQTAVFEYLGGGLSKLKLEIILKENKKKEFYQYLWIPELTEEVELCLSYSSIPYFEKLLHPILIIQGTADIVIPKDSYVKIEEALNKAGNTKSKLIVLENANHSMTVENVSDFPYWSMLHPNYFNTIEEWLNTISNKK